MPIVHARHPVPVAPKGSRSRVPAIAWAEAVTPVEVPRLEAGALHPVPPDLVALRLMRGQETVEGGGLLLGADGIWCPVWAEPAPNRYGRERRAPRPVTEREATDMLCGSPDRPVDPSATWLCMSPFVALQGGEGKGAPGEPEAARLADLRARLVRWVARNLAFHEGTLLVLAGWPAIYDLYGPEIGHPAAVRFDRDVFGTMKAGDKFSVPLSAVDRYLALRVRDGDREIGQPKADAALAFAAGALARYPAAAECKAPVAHFVNEAALKVFAVGRGVGGKRASAEAPALRARMEAALAEMAPWAGLGALGLIEREEWPEALARLTDAARLVLRSYPWSQDAKDLERILNHAEIVAMPAVAGEAEDLDALSGLAGTGAGADAPAAVDGGEGVQYDVSQVRGAFVFDEAGNRIGRCDRLYVRPDGRAGDVVLTVGRREVAVPFTAFGFAYGGHNDTELRLRMERPDLEAWIARRRQVPADPRKRW